MAAENNLGRDNIQRLVWRIALPSMLGQFVSVLYSIVDRMYIGNIAQVGTLALAGVGICGPVITMVGSVASLVGVGGAPLMSIRLGEGKQEEARRILSNSFLMLCGFSLAVMAVVLPLRRPLLTLFGASPTIYAYADTYFFTYLLGTPFALLAAGMNQFIICQGFAKTGMCAVLLGAGLNILLDPLFIFTFGMGVQGGALASVLSQMASAAFVLLFLRGRRPAVRLSLGGYSLRIMRKVLTLGVTPFFIIAFDNVMIIAMNAVLQRYGGPDQGDMLITCATIVQSFMLVVTMPLGGISGGTQSILSYNYGARQVERVRQAQRYITRLCLGYTAVMTLVAWGGGELFVRLFTQDAAMASQAVWAIRVCTMAIVPLGAQYAFVDGFTAIGQVRLSLFLSFWRKLIYFTSIFALPALWGATATFFAEAISDVVGPLTSVLVHRRAMGPILHRRATENAALAPPTQVRG